MPISFRLLRPRVLLLAVLAFMAGLPIAGNAQATSDSAGAAPPRQPGLRLQREAAAGVSRAQLLLAYAYAEGDYGLTENDSLAVEWLATFARGQTFARTQSLNAVWAQLSGIYRTGQGQFDTRIADGDAKRRVAQVDRRPPDPVRAAYWAVMAAITRDSLPEDRRAREEVEQMAARLPSSLDRARYPDLGAEAMFMASRGLRWPAHRALAGQLDRLLRR